LKTKLARNVALVNLADVCVGCLAGGNFPPSSSFQPDSQHKQKSPPVTLTGGLLGGVPSPESKEHGAGTLI